MDPSRHAFSADDHRVDAVVIGSGFGGAVAAARLAQAGLTVTVVERGRRWTRGSFPRDETNLDDRWLWEKNRGLYDLRWLDTMISVQGTGWGGGSLVYANVFARPPVDVFQEGWPPAYSRAGLDPYYDLVAHMLEVRPVTVNPTTGSMPLRTAAMDAVASGMSRSAGTVHPQLAVRFTNPAEAVTNRHGQTQHGCTFVGECVLGCNIGAKNSLDYNYLAVAETHGATALTDTQVRGISADVAGYVVDLRDLETGSDNRILARSVFVAAGAVGTTELLLRSRDITGGLPNLSQTLGSNYSGNGDYLAFVKRLRTPVDPDEAPTITTTTIVDFDLKDQRVWFQVQDGGYPKALSSLVANLDPTRARRQKITTTIVKLITLTKIQLRPRPTAGSNVMTMLLMGRDSSDGRLTLDHNEEVRVTWSNRKNVRLYRAEGQVARLVARSLGGRMAPSPAWRFLRQAITVHNLGGVPIADNIRDGVVDHNGQAHGYPGLFVMDGSTVPTATGVNPSATIAAMTERNVEVAIRQLTDNPAWKAPEWPEVQPVDVPEDDAMTTMNLLRRNSSGHGVRFREHLTGSLFDARETSRIDLHLECRLRGWKSLLADSTRSLDVTGSATLAGIATDLDVTGSLRLFQPGSDVAMHYSLTLTSPGSHSWSFEADKTQTPYRPLRLWHDLTTMQVRLVGPEETTIHAGTAHIPVADALRLAASIRGEAFSWPQRLKSSARFLYYFSRGAIRGTLPTRSHPTDREIPQ